MERHILNENDDYNNLTVLKTKYPQSIISHSVLETLYNEDPTEDKSLFDWMVKQNIRTSHKNDVNNLILRLVKDYVLFQNKLQIKDINFYHSMENLENDINDVKNLLTKKERKSFKIQEGDDLYEDFKFRVIKPQDLNDICNTGFDTSWCGTSNSIPGNINDYLVYLIINKSLSRPDVNKIEDYQEFNYEQNRYYRLKKLLLLINKKFKGTAYEADLDDYTIYDATGNEYHGSISELTNEHIEHIIFCDFEKSEKKDKIKKELELPNLELVESWCKHTGIDFEQKKLLKERYNLITESYQNPELSEQDRIELIYMCEPYRNRPPKGTMGTVIKVEQTPMGKEYKIKWDNGSTLSLLPTVDIYKKL